MSQSAGKPLRTPRKKRRLRDASTDSAPRNDGWDLIGGQVAKEIEHYNHAGQKAVVASLVKSLIASAEIRGDRMMPAPAEAALCEVHRAGTLFLLEKPGCYRDTDIRIAGRTTERPPPGRQVRSEMRVFFTRLTAMWKKSDALDVAAYAFWRIARISPFRAGNAQAASFFAYACLCLKLGSLLPNAHTVADQILADRAGREMALRDTDLAFARSPGKHLRAMKVYLDGLLLRQMQSADLAK